MSELIITNRNFEKEVLDSDIPVLLDFWAAWCGPCMRLSPEIDKIAEKYEGKIKVGKVNVDDEPELAENYQVLNIPMLMVIKDKNITDSAIGYRTFEQLEDLINNYTGQRNAPS